MVDTPRACPDCQTPLRRIQIVDHQGGAAAVVGLVYMFDETPKMGLWKGGVKNSAGQIHGHLCERCQRVLLYAEPRVGAPA
jgi:hypothetical protein